MKKATKILALLLALMMVLSLAACGETGKGGADNDADGSNTAGGGDTDDGSSVGDDKQEDESATYPALDLPDVSGLTLTEEEFSDVKFSYPADKWTADSTDSVTLYLNDTLEDNARVNMNVKYEAEMDEFSQSDLDEITETLEGQMSFMTANAAEFRSVGDIPVMYIDMVVGDKDAYVDFLIENSGLSESDLESVGGREGILEIMPATNQMMIYAIKDGHLFSLTGIYFDDAQHNDLLELASAVLSTLQLV